MKTDLEIAYDADVKPIKEIAAKIGISEDDLIPYGKHIAKIPLKTLEGYKDRKNGKLILVTAITATPAGEGKTVTSIGLIQGLSKIGKNVVGALREPSLGPTFGTVLVGHPIVLQLPFDPDVSDGTDMVEISIIAVPTC